MTTSPIYTAFTIAIRLGRCNSARRGSQRLGVARQRRADDDRRRQKVVFDVVDTPQAEPGG